MTTSPSRPATARLFVAGRSVLALRAESAVRRAMPESLVLEVIDVVTHPELGREAGVLMTPMLVVRRGAEVLRWVGDFESWRLDP